MFQVRRRNFINLRDYILIESDDEIEEDDELRDFIVNEQEQENTEPGSQRPATSQVRILQSEQLRHLGEGRIYFWTKGTISGYFAEYKRGMAMSTLSSWNCIQNPDEGKSQHQQYRNVTTTLTERLKGLNVQQSVVANTWRDLKQ